MIVVDAPPICDMLSAFSDGELDAFDAQRFRLHLAGCAAYSRDLRWNMELSARLSTLRSR